LQLHESLMSAVTLSHLYLKTAVDIRVCIGHTKSGLKGDGINTGEAWRNIFSKQNNATYQ
jgi:hypothetical protein